MAKLVDLCVEKTPVEAYPELGVESLLVKREDLCCPEGPHFSKMRGVFAHINNLPETIRTIGVLDTSHSQGGHAVALACNRLEKNCVEYFPVRKKYSLFLDCDNFGPTQIACDNLGAHIFSLPAARSSILYHAARRHLFDTYGADSYLMPNALKLQETVTETALEVTRTGNPKWWGKIKTIIVPASSGTIAAGVMLGLAATGWSGQFVVHLGYSRPIGAVINYMERMIGDGFWGHRGGLIDFWQRNGIIIDEGYRYSDAATPGVDPPFPCNVFYDLKALRWYLCNSQDYPFPALFWNIG